jgi:hypothetical protein
MAPAKKQAVKKSKKSPSDDEIRQRIAEFEAVELRDMVNFPSESSLNSRTRLVTVPKYLLYIRRRLRLLETNQTSRSP